MLETTNTHGEIYHMDFSENLTQLFKYEPQSSHFNKSQYSLHCSVKHTGLEESPYHYLYHFTNVMQHDHISTHLLLLLLMKSSNQMEFLKLCTSSWITVVHKTSVNGFSNSGTT